MKSFQRYIAVILCTVMLFCTIPVSADQSEWDVTAQFVHGQAKTPSAGETYGDWEIFVMARAGLTAPKGYYAAYLTLLERVLDQEGGKLSGPVTGNLRLALSLLALDQDLTDVGGHNLMPLITDTAFVCRTTVMGPAFAILVLENCGRDAEVEAVYLQHLLDKQLEDGGWALSGKIADPDATAMTLQALSFLQEEAGVNDAIQRGLNRLSAMQLDNGGYHAWGVSGAESIAQAIIALCMLDIDLTDTRFVKNGNTLLDALLAYRLEDGSFCHTEKGSFDVMATQQAMLALESLRRREADLPSIYHLTQRVTVDRSFVGLPARDVRISVPKKDTGIMIPYFSDIQGLPQEQAIVELSRRGIVNGMGGTSFAPDGLLNRAQFCAMAVRALGLPKAAAYGFTDVPAGQWYTDAVNSAAAFGAVNGVGNGKFAPSQTITRQEAAVLVSRLAKSCGMAVSFSETAARNVLSQFGDYRTCADWAKEGLAFCYANGVLDDSVMNIQPLEPVTRGEAAGMFYALLDGALLLED